MRRCRVTAFVIYVGLFINVGPSLAQEPLDRAMRPIYGFYLEENEAANPVFDAWLEPFRDLGARRNIIQGIGNTDHLSFNRLRTARAGDAHTHRPTRRPTDPR